MHKIDGDSGAEIVINVAPFDDAMQLKAAIGKQLSGHDIDLSKLTGQSDVKDVFPLVIKAVLSLDSSEDVQEAIFKCLLRCKYNGEKITKHTFENEDARADYYTIVVECLKVNLRPFFKSHLSKLEASGLTLEKILK